MSLEISQATQSRILQEAQKQGVPVDVLLQRLMTEQEMTAKSEAVGLVTASVQSNVHSIAHLQKSNPQEWARLFRVWADGHDPKIPVLSDEAMSRESIYPDLA